LQRHIRWHETEPTNFITVRADLVDFWQRMALAHIHPVRQSGPIPAYDGTWNIEDIKKLYGNMRAPWDYTA
jgi:hypothetical protein